MKAGYIFLVCCLLALAAKAQRVLHDFRNVSLAEALTTLAERSTEYDITFLYSDLENIMVSRSVRNMDVLAAVKAVCKGQDVKVKRKDRCVFVTLKEKDEPFALYGKVYDNKTRNEVPGTLVELLTMDSIVVSRRVARSMMISDKDTFYHSYFRFEVPRRDASYILRASMPSYRTSTMTVSIGKIGSREYSRELPPLLIRDNSILLKEVVVSASKVMFYYKGDTVVYNADAFVLAEGSMLDALVKQLPGVELKSNGDIYHNGKLVQNLLLNGKDFFRSDRKALLENLPTYMVKEVQVYNKRGERSEFLNTDIPNDVEYVMDVKLKKEYSIGYIANLEGGTGFAKDHDTPYLGRLFALRFTDHSRIGIYANVNNLNDERRPGESDSWKPSDLKEGTLRQETVGFTYNVDARNKKWEISGDTQFSHSVLNNAQTTQRTNFLSTGDTHERILQSAKNKNLQLDTGHNFKMKSNYFTFTFRPGFQYHRFDNTSGMDNQTRGDTLINSFSSKRLSKGRDWMTGFKANSNIRFSKNSVDNIYIDVFLLNRNRKEDLFNRYSLLYAKDKVHDYADQYYKNHPDHHLETEGRIAYSTRLNQNLWGEIIYQLKYQYDNRNSHLYRLDRLQDYEQGELGCLPSVAEYELGIDWNNSFESRSSNTDHIATWEMNWNKRTDKGKWWAQCRFPFTLRHARLDYQRGAVDTTLVRNTFLVGSNNTFLQWDSSDRKYRFYVQYWLDNRSPDLMNMVNIHDDTDPLHIKEGSRGLKNSFAHRYEFSVDYNHHDRWGISFGNEGGATTNAIAMGYTYDAATGVRTYRATNVNGNWNMLTGVNFNLRLPHLRVGNMIHYSFVQNVDLVGVTKTTDMARSVVRTNGINEVFNLRYSFGQQQIQAKFNGNWRRMTSDRTDFTNLHVRDFTYSLSGVFNLPWQFQISTDLSLFSRRGYGSSELNTDDLVWNARLSKSFLKGNLVVMLDGFDILGNLSSISYSINGQGRTEIRRNVLPRYALLHIQYRLNKRPKKNN